jgi:hypothetical protein
LWPNWDREGHGDQQPKNLFHVAVPKLRALGAEKGCDTHFKSKARLECNQFFGSGHKEARNPRKSAKTLKSGSIISGHNTEQAGITALEEGDMQTQWLKAEQAAEIEFVEQRPHGPATARILQAIAPAVRRKIAGQIELPMSQQAKVNRKKCG